MSRIVVMQIFIPWNYRRTQGPNQSGNVKTSNLRATVCMFDTQQ